MVAPHLSLYSPLARRTGSKWLTVSSDSLHPVNLLWMALCSAGLEGICRVRVGTPGDECCAEAYPSQRCISHRLANGNPPQRFEKKRRLVCAWSLVRSCHCISNFPRMKLILSSPLDTFVLRFLGLEKVIDRVRKRSHCKTTSSLVGLTDIELDV
jgi:hypothetical protein